MAYAVGYGASMRRVQITELLRIHVFISLADLRFIGFFTARTQSLQLLSDLLATSRATDDVRIQQQE